MTNKKKIYLLATNTKKPISRAIRFYTGEKFNHASIAFDSSLVECYSFSMSGSGFEKEALHTWPTWTEFELRELEVTKDQFDKIKAYATGISKGKKSFSYGGILGILVNRPVEMEEALFCSEFVERACLAGGLPKTASNPALTTPETVIRRQNSRHIASGLLQQYIVGNFKKRQNLIENQIDAFTEVELSLF